MRKKSIFSISLFVAGLFMFAEPGTAQQGDPLRGEALYVGTSGFSEGGAPCLACHGIAGRDLGRAAGASYGPDLTTLYEDYGEEGLTYVLDDMSFESMVAIYADRPLSKEEQADLIAFLAKVSSEEGSPAIHVDLMLHVLLATTVIFIFIWAFGRRRLQGVRKSLTERAGTAKGELA